jgi:hypothetical protein
MPGEANTPAKVGRKRSDTVRLTFAIPSAVVEELKRRETKVGLRRGRIATVIISNALIGGVVQR